MDEVLSLQDIEHFLRRGHVILRDVFSRDTARAWAQHAFERLGYNPDDPSTWKEEIIHMGHIGGKAQPLDVQTFAPKAWAAICQLIGGPQRLKDRCTWSDDFIANFRKGADHPWLPPSPQVGGWHKDGDSFLHFLDSPEQGLLPIVIWSDIAPRGGGTFAACDSVPVVARYLAQHPEGVMPDKFGFQTLVAECHDFVEVTGRAGDVALLHPFVLHASSQNVLRVPRFITNPPVSLAQPMNFNRADERDFSPVEQAVLRGLGVRRLDFFPSQPRQTFVPQRVLRYQAKAAQAAAESGQQLTGAPGKSGG